MDLASKLVKLQKKQKHKEKLDEARAIKQAEFEAAERLRKEIESKLLEEERIARQKQEEARRELERIADEIASYKKRQGDCIEYWANVQEREELFKTEVEKIQRLQTTRMR